MTCKLLAKLTEMIKDAEHHDCSQLAVELIDLKALLKIVAEVTNDGPETPSNITGTESSATLCA